MTHNSWTSTTIVSLSLSKISALNLVCVNVPLNDIFHLRAPSLGSE
jgi:hypothetical protein